MTTQARVDRAIRWAIAAEAQPAGDLRAWLQQGSPLVGGVSAGFRGEVDALAWDDPLYPEPLRHLSRPPAALFVRGGAPLPARQDCVAIIGSRDCTDEGRHHAFDLARGLAQAGVVVISGLALGIDAAAHEGALAGRGRTLAVLASAVDTPSPTRNHGLAGRIHDSGGWLVSERPPRAAVRPAEFPRRNRIVAALSKLVIVVEAGLPSGTLSTAEQALQLGTEVGAVPGPVHSPASRGVNRLIAAGAQVITGVDDVLSLVGRPPRKTETLGDPDEEAVLRAVPGGSAPRDAWIRGSSLPEERARATLLRLLGRGALRLLPGGRVGRVL